MSFSEPIYRESDKEKKERSVGSRRKRRAMKVELPLSFRLRRLLIEILSFALTRVAFLVHRMSEWGDQGGDFV
jgi:hypothetical protein